MRLNAGCKIGCQQCVSKEEEDDESDLVLQMRRERKKERSQT